MFNLNRKFLTSLTMLLTFKMAWVVMFSVSCSKVGTNSQQVNLQSNFIDYDCASATDYLQNEKYELELRHLNEKHYFENTILKASKTVQKKLRTCVRQNFVASEQASNEDFKKFTSFYFKEYASFETINHKLKSATNNRVDFYKILNLLNDEQAYFKQTVVWLYNILAKLIGPQIVPYLIFNLLVVKEQSQANNALATAVAHLLNNQIVKSCIIYSKEAIVLSQDMLLKNYQQVVWSSKNRFHPIIHEFAHSLDYFTRMSYENLTNLPIVAKTNNVKCNNDLNGSNILNGNIDKTLTSNSKPNPIFSTAAFDLQEYLFVNIRNHNLQNNEQSKEILANLIVPSRYGRDEGKRSELFAEAFVYWISTAENKRKRNWQILNRFFLEYFKAKYYLK